ncbi:MAG: DNA polymerase/3'-5' exonuclease PolX [Campylobacterales bacterium]|nr:DNA polymerase/3'-5' exonuclease PolX [Campylobacterales bacterium]
MGATNQEIANAFNEIAELLDIEGANPFRVRAYRNAARTILSYPSEMSTLLLEGFDLTTLKTIGKDLSAKITEMVETGELQFLRELREKVSPGLEDLLRLPGLGPKRVHTLHEVLGINSAADLKTALETGKLEEVSGFGPAMIASLRTALGKKGLDTRRYRLDQIGPVAERIVSLLNSSQGVIRIEIAGSIRRRREDPKDIDIVASCTDSREIMERFTTMEDIQSVVMSGPTRSSVILRSGIHVDLRAVTEEEFATTLHHFTGSKAHNIELRTLASRAGLKINEYGVFRGDTRIAYESEAAIYQTLGMPYIVPELRENRGEIEAALAGRLPRLIEVSQIRGDLHAHTTYSDGINTIEEMALAARERGYEYLAITDHTHHLKIAHGLDEARILEQIETIDRLNGSLEGITLLKSAEVDILDDGTLDLPDSVLEKLDFTVCAVHYRFNLSAKEQTARILKAMENPYFTIFAHPTGRLLGLRDPYLLDMETIIRTCAERHIILELNSQPDRLDIHDLHCRMAKDAGVKIAISTDAHSVRDLDLIRYGISQGRRGWLETDDVINTRRLDDIVSLLRQRH